MSKPAAHSAATRAAQVFCCERRKGLNKVERTGYLRSGFMALSPVKVMASTPTLLSQPEMAKRVEEFNAQMADIGADNRVDETKPKPKEKKEAAAPGL